MPPSIFILVILFALFILLCGAGHYLRCMQATSSSAYAVVNVATAAVSMATSLYLMPLVPNLMGTLDQNLEDLVKLNQETTKSKEKLLTFMAFLCHEIRNPLFAITCHISFLSDSCTSEQQQEGLNAIQQSAELMLRLVNDVLEIGKLEAGKLHLESRRFDLRKLLDGVISSAHAQVAHFQSDQEKSVTFAAKIADDVPHIVLGDSARLSQIAYNILSNARKFTKQGSICFSVSTYPLKKAVDNGLLPGLLENEAASKSEQQNNNCSEKEYLFSERAMCCMESGTATGASGTEGKVVLKMEISDTGPGIPNEHIDRIFQPYSQGKLSDYREHGGTGLGLAIVSNIIQLMGGSIHVQSEVGKGSTFFVFVPVQVSDGPVGELNNSADKLQYSSNPVVISSPRDESTAGTNETSNDRVVKSVSQSLWVPDKHNKLQIPNSTELDKLVDTATATATMPSVKSPPVTVKKSELTKFDLPTNTGVVLVVDDNDINRRMLGRMLTSFNLQYEEAVNGQVAVDKMLQSRNYTKNQDDTDFCLVLMDVSMPVMDGYEATRTLRGHGFSLPIMALTANAIEGNRQAALDAGVTEFATKPILRQDLNARVKAYLSGYSPTPTATA